MLNRHGKKSSTVTSCSQRCCFHAAVFLLVLVLSPAFPAHAVSAEPGTSLLSAATAKGTRAWSSAFGASYDSKLGHAYVWEAGVNHYLFDYISFSYGALLGYASPRRTKDGVYGGPQIGVRWHFFRGERWSIDMEALAAAVFHQHPLTENSLHFNFDLQPGLGVTYLLNRETMIRGGARWHHLSNARVKGKERNLGYDGPMAYFEMVKSF